MIRHPLSLAVLVLASNLVMEVVMAQAADEKKTQRTISVVGQGKVSAKPDIAEISVGFVNRARTAREALETNNQRLTDLFQLLRENGIEERDIQTLRFSVHPEYGPIVPGPPGQPPGHSPASIIGYQVQNSVRITLRDKSRAGPLVDAVVARGANQVYGITYRISEPFTDQARRLAMEDARKKAALLAGQAGLVVGLPVSIREEASPYAVAPPPPSGPYAMAASAAPVPLASGEQDISVTVHVVFEADRQP
jgi:uncharacterized protein YggE